MIKIIFESAQVEIRGGTSQRTGRPYQIREQRCVIEGAGRFPQETRIVVPDTVGNGTIGYQPGTYEATTPLVIGRFGPEASRDLGLRLLPAQAVKAA